MALTLAEANRIADGAMEKAEGINIRISVAIVDDGGRLILLKRMDGGIWAANWGCHAKAIGAAAFGGPPDLDDGAKASLLESVKSMGGGHMVMPSDTSAGLSIYRDNVLIGGVGVGGGSGAEDRECSSAGIAKL
ncbi:MAG: heme-binding protein [Chloroflexi bacterium]|nr:heme-binding protein [Chloroflexota bacterium]